MKNLFNDNKYNDLEKRFPNDSYVYGDIFLLNKTNVITSLTHNEYIDYKEKNDIDIYTAVFKKINWSIDNDLRRKSKIFDAVKFRYEFSSDLYCENAVKYTLILLINKKTKEEKYIDTNSIELLDSKVFSSLVDCFFEVQPHQDRMTEEEQSELSYDIYKYLSYERRKQRGMANEEPPGCPSIVLEKSLIENTKWTLDYIRSLNPRDVSSLSIYMSQQNFEKFANSEERHKIFARNINGELEEFENIDEVKSKYKLFEIGEYDENLDQENDNKTIPIIKNKEGKNEKKTNEELDKENNEVENLLIDLIDNSEEAAKNFFERAKQQNNIKKK